MKLVGLLFMILVISSWSVLAADVACNFPEDCPGGYCDRDPLNPGNNVCRYLVAQDYCGNGVCEASYGENNQSCAKDCAPTSTIPPPDNTLVLVAVIGGVIIVLLIIIIVLLMRKAERKALHENITLPLE